jgi:hypothetical protein
MGRQRSEMARFPGVCYHSSMLAKQFELVVEKVRRMPEERQAAAVEALEVIAAQEDDRLTDAEIRGVKLSRQCVRAGGHASEEVARAFFARFRA